MEDCGTSKSLLGKDLSCVTIIGRNYGNILTMARALGIAGYQVEILKVYRKKPKKLNLLATMKPDAYCKYVKNYRELIVNNTTEEVTDYLMQIGDETKRRLLMPVDDYTAYVVDENFEQLNRYYIIPSAAQKSGEIIRLMDKNLQKKSAEKFELPMLRSVLITLENGKFEIPKEISYPCFIKPNVSMKSTKALMKRCEDEEELYQTLSSYVQKDDVEVLVEEYAEIKAEYSILGLSADDKVIAPGLFKVIEGGHKERKGVTIKGKTISCEKMQDIIDKCIVFIGALHYTGLFDVDLIETTDGKIYFVELNFRAGASIHAFTESGINLPGMLADYLIKGIEINEKCELQQAEKIFVSEKVMLEEYARSDMSFQGIKRNIKKADICFVKDERDPKPYRYFKKYYLVAALMRIPFRIREHIKNKF